MNRPFAVAMDASSVAPCVCQARAGNCLHRRPYVLIALGGHHLNSVTAVETRPVRLSTRGGHPPGRRACCDARRVAPWQRATAGRLVWAHGGWGILAGRE